MTDMTNEAFARALTEQQAEITKLANLLSSLTSACAARDKVILGLQEHLAGSGAAFQIFAELVMASSPDFKHLVATSTSQILARPDVANNETLREQLTALNAAARAAPRTTPEGRRESFQVVSPGDQPSET